MKRLTAVDAMFTALDVPGYPLHGTGVVFLDPTTAREPLTFERLTALFEERLPYMPPFRRRLVPVPLGLDRPYWIDDPDFDLDAHLNHVAVPAPGGEENLLELVSRIGTTPLDPHRPLWAAWLIEGMADGRLVLAIKAHHAVIDGVGGMAMLGSLVDPTPEPHPPTGPPPAYDPEPTPSSLDVLRQVALDNVWRPARTLRAVARLAGRISVGASGRFDPAVSDDDPAASDPVPAAAPASFNRVSPTAPHRNLAITSFPLDEVKRLGQAEDATVNDVFLSIVGGAVRRYLAEKNETPTAPLLAAVPMNTRTGDEEDAFHNQLTVLARKVRADLADPLERLRAMVRIRGPRRAGGGSGGDDPIEVAFDFLSPGWITVLARLYVAQLAGRISHPFHLLLSNVPGPAEPWYVGGARIDGFHIQMMPFPGLGPIVVALSLDGVLYLSVTGTKEITPDIDRFAIALDEEYAALSAAVDAAANDTTNPPEDQ